MEKTFKLADSINLSVDDIEKARQWDLSAQFLEEKTKWLVFACNWFKNASAKRRV